MQAAAGFASIEANTNGVQHVAGIESFVHLHDADAGLVIAGFDRPLNRRGSTPSGQQGCVDIPAAMHRHGQYFSRQDQAVGHHDHEVWLKVCEKRPGVIRAQCFGLVDLEPRLPGNLLDRAGLQSTPAPGRPVGLREHRNGPVTGAQQGLQGRNGEIWRARENDAQRAFWGHGIQSTAFAASFSACLRNLSSFFSNMRRLSGDR